MGKVSTASVSTPDKRLTLNPSAVTKNASPKSPKTIEGTPAKLATESRTTSFRNESRLYSFNHTAHATPKGSAIAMAPAAKRNVPTRHGKTPPSVIIFCGASTMKSQVKAPLPSTRRNTQAATNAAQFKYAATRRPAKASTCVIKRRGRDFSCARAQRLFEEVMESSYTAGVL